MRANFFIMKRWCSAALLVLLAPYCLAQYSFNQDQLLHDLKVLSADSLEGRKVGSEGSRKARAFILERLSANGIKPFPGGDYLQEFSFTQSFGQMRTGNGANILAVIEGKKKETFVISAHYDHVGIINQQIYNGADDNASGTAALLAIAEYFKNNPPEHRLIIAFFDAEESGLRGSAHFVNSIDLKKENIVLNVNMDMISRSDKNELYACGTYYYPHLKKPLEKLNLPENINLMFGHDHPDAGRDNWTSQSDQLNFHLKKIPFLYFGVEDHADYHKPTDTFEKINSDFYTRSTETVLRSIKALDKSLD
jgi:Zn-dependent M28 family amino/carboxypeptidase